MIRIFTSPSRYIQGYNVIKNFGKYISHLGSKPFIIGGKTALSTIRESVSKSAAEHSMECDFAVFSGKGTRSDATKLSRKATDFGADIIVGAGGGLVLDTAKAVAYEMDSWLVMVPTVASTDAPCSAAAQQYTDDHQHDRVISHSKGTPMSSLQILRSLLRLQVDFLWQEWVTPCPLGLKPTPV